MRKKNRRIICGNFRKAADGILFFFFHNHLSFGIMLEEGKEKSMSDHNFTYMVECSDGTLYTGWTTEVKKRVEAHNAGKGAKYTKSRRPVRLVYYEEFKTKQEAMRREYEIKHFSREKKKKMIETFSFTTPRIL